jgi:hypothetical protein
MYLKNISPKNCLKQHSHSANDNGLAHAVEKSIFGQTKRMLFHSSKHCKCKKVWMSIFCKYVLLYMQTFEPSGNSKSVGKTCRADTSPAKPQRVKREPIAITTGAAKLIAEEDVVIGFESELRSIALHKKLFFETLFHTTTLQ